MDKNKVTRTDAVDATTIEAVRINSSNNEISCEEAAAIAAGLAKSMSEVGAACDLLELHIIKCQLGLFGYHPQKKIVSAAQSVVPELEQAIREKLVGGTLPCKTAWEIAEKLALPRMKVASACEALQIKVSPCQLGAF